MKQLPVLLICIILFACSKQKDSQALRVAATPVPHAEILEHIKPELEAEGIKLEIIQVDDYNIPNRALEEKDIQANYFQHIPFMDEQIKAFGYKIHCFARIHLEPMGLYSEKVQKLQDLPSKGIVALPNDPTNEYRALKLMEDKGLITLKTGTNLTATKMSIATNPKNLTFREIDAAMLSRTLSNVDLAAIPTNFALQAKLNPHQDALAIESKDSPYANIIAIRDGDENDPRLIKLRERMLTDEMRAFLLEKYQGAIVPVLELCP